MLRIECCPAAQQGARCASPAVASPWRTPRDGSHLARRPYSAFRVQSRRCGLHERRLAAVHVALELEKAVVRLMSPRGNKVR